MRNDYVSVEKAIGLPGLRIAFSRGVPGPWGEACRCFFDIKGIDYAPVEQTTGGANEALLGWTRQSSAPVAMLGDERPRAHWSEQLLLAERLAPSPRLVPQAEDERAAMFGICFEICGEDGFGWSARAVLLESSTKSGNAPSARFRHKYTSAEAVDHAKSRVIAVLDMLARRLDSQVKRKSVYLVGDKLSAADIYWTTFSNLVAPIDASRCPMPDFYRAMCEGLVKSLGAPVPSVLVEHRDLILNKHFQLPMWF